MSSYFVACRNKRRRTDPATPDINANISKRRFDGQVRHHDPRLCWPSWYKCIHVTIGIVHQHLVLPYERGDKYECMKLLLDVLPPTCGACCLF